MAKDSGSILVFDTETTGTIPDKDQIIELCIQRSLTDPGSSKTWRFKPDVPIHPAAQAVHGISMEDLLDCPAFAACAEEICSFFEAAELIVGYNVQFDLAFLLSEFNRASQSPPKLEKKLIVDPYQLWRHFEPRSLAGAHKKFVGEDFQGAHSAAEDVAATGRVLSAMLDAFELQTEEWKDIAALCPIQSEQKGWIGPSNHFMWEKDVAVFGFGKHRGTPIHVVANSDNGSYVDWMSKKDFPKHVMEIAQEARRRGTEDFIAWLKNTYC